MGVRNCHYGGNCIYSFRPPENPEKNFVKMFKTYKYEKRIIPSNLKLYLIKKNIVIRKSVSNFANFNFYKIL